MVVRLIPLLLGKSETTLCLRGRRIRIKHTSGKPGINETENKTEEEG